MSFEANILMLGFLYMEIKKAISLKQNRPKWHWLYATIGWTNESKTHYSLLLNIKTDKDIH